MPSKIELVAGYGFGGFFGGAGRGGAVSVGMAVAIAIRMAVARGRSDCDRLAGIGEIRWGGFGDVGDRADLNDGRLGLLENEFFVDGADFGLFFEGLLAACAIFFGGG